MPKSNLDWLGIVSLWIGALVMAVNAAAFPLISGAPFWFASAIWNYLPLPLITIYLGIALYRLVAPRTIQVVNEPFGGGTVSRQERRQQIIADGRRLIAAYNRQRTNKSFVKYLQGHDEWHAIRPQMDPSVVRDMENGRLVVATDGELKDGKVIYLSKELDRLEREWGLL